MTEPSGDDVIKTVEATPCPRCGECKLSIVWRLEAKPIGTFSLSGFTPKVSASKWPYLVCGGCGVEARGEADDGE